VYQIKQLKRDMKSRDKFQSKAIRSRHLAPRNVTVLKANKHQNRQLGDFKRLQSRVKRSKTGMKLSEKYGATFEPIRYVILNSLSIFK
jgi:hypothetical protein